MNCDIAAETQTIVCKFGGTSMADEASVEKVARIISQESARRYIVVSAPGKTGEYRKVTDALIDCYHEIEQTGACSKTFPEIIRRYTLLNCEISGEEFQNVLLDVKRQMEAEKNYDFCVSRGEYLSAYFFAKKIGFSFIDAAELVRFKGGVFDALNTLKLCRLRLKNVQRAVIPGFYGLDETGEIAVFSRGGSDITGSVVAQAVNASLYENWTDVDGILSADPHIVPQAHVIEQMTYSELRELAYLGASVMHSDALQPLIKSRTPLQVRNTFRPESKGTLICSCANQGGRRIVTGIAGKKDIRILFIHKIGLNAQKSVVRKVLSILEKYGVIFEHMPSSLDAVNFLIPYSSMPLKTAEKIMEEIKIEIHPDNIRVLDNFAIVSIVGKNMFQQTGVAARMLGSLAAEKINIRLLIQGCREINIIAGVDEHRYEDGIRALYKEFMEQSECS